MDEIVKQALAKWPDVPHCYDWLTLDARGYWRMRDAHAQQHGLPGERITSPTLIGFIQRNYTHDETGRWYFQNGPQRVYVNLEAAPYIARTRLQEFYVQTGKPLGRLVAAWMTEQGRLFLQNDQTHIALLDDRDLAECLPRLRTTGGEPLDEEVLLSSLNEAVHSSSADLQLMLMTDAEKTIPVGFVAENAVAKTFGFVKQPRPSS